MKSADQVSTAKAPVTVLLAVRNEEANLSRCLAALDRASRVVVVDSWSEDESVEIAQRFGAEVVQFEYAGGYPKKRQWAMDSVSIDTPWTLLLDADEVVPPALWTEIVRRIESDDAPDGFLITKEFHFLGQKFRWGGFSHRAVLLFKTGRARFERLLEVDPSGLDMEVHERVHVDGKTGELATPLVHEDFKGLEAYLERHNKYSTWEAWLRHTYLRGGQYGSDAIRPSLFGSLQSRRRFLKLVALRMPFEAHMWFLYHYLLRLGFLEGRAGLIASRIRSQYISQVRAKMFEISGREPNEHTGTPSEG